jgi:hypothetical protein
VSDEYQAETEPKRWSTLTQLIAQENVLTFVRCESFKSWIDLPPTAFQMVSVQFSSPCSSCILSYALRSLVFRSLQNNFICSVFHLGVIVVVCLSS